MYMIKKKKCRIMLVKIYIFNETIHICLFIIYHFSVLYVLENERIYVGNI